MNATCNTCGAPYIDKIVETAKGPRRGVFCRCTLADASATNGGEPANQPSQPVTANGTELADAIGGYLTRFVVLPSEYIVDLLVLWVLHTHVFQSAWSTPYLRVTSAAPESGKSTLFDVLALVVRGAWKTVNPSTAVLYRRIERDTPTLLLDEMDTCPLRIAGTWWRCSMRATRRAPRWTAAATAASWSRSGCSAKGIRRDRPADPLRHRPLAVDHHPAGEGHTGGAPGARPLHRPEGGAGGRGDQGAVQGLGRGYGDGHHRHRAELPDELSGRAAEVWWNLLAIADNLGAD